MQESRVEALTNRALLSNCQDLAFSTTTLMWMVSNIKQQKLIGLWKVTPIDSISIFLMPLLAPLFLNLEVRSMRMGLRPRFIGRSGEPRHRVIHALIVMKREGGKCTSQKSLNSPLPLFLAPKIVLA